MKQYIVMLILLAGIDFYTHAGPVERITDEHAVDTFISPENDAILTAEKKNEQAAVALGIQRYEGREYLDYHGNIQSITYKNTVDLINTINKQLTDSIREPLSADETAALFKNIGNWDTFDIELDKILTQRKLIINHQKFINDLHEAQIQPGNKTWPAIKMFFSTFWKSSTLPDTLEKRGYTIHSTTVKDNIFLPIDTTQSRLDALQAHQETTVPLNLADAATLLNTQQNPLAIHMKIKELQTILAKTDFDTLTTDERNLINAVFKKIFTTQKKALEITTENYSQIRKILTTFTKKITDTFSKETTIEELPEIRDKSVIIPGIDRILTTDLSTFKTLNKQILLTLSPKMLEENPTLYMQIIAKLLHVQPSLENIETQLQKLLQATTDVRSMNANIDLINGLLKNIGISRSGGQDWTVPLPTPIRGFSGEFDPKARSIGNFIKLLQNLYTPLSDRATIRVTAQTPDPTQPEDTGFQT